MTSPKVPEPEEVPVAKLTRGTWIQAIDEDGCDHGEAEVLHVEAYQGCAVVPYRPQGASDPRTSYFDDAASTVPVLSAEHLAEMKAIAERATKIADIRSFADFLESNPWAPIENLHMQWSPNPNGDIWNSGTEGVAQVRQMAQQMGAEAVQSNVMTKATRHFGPVEYSLIAWHKDGRPAEPVTCNWCADPASPDPALHPGDGRTHVPADDLGFGFSREDDPTPVSPARGGPVHTGAVVAGGELVDETPADPVTVHFTFGVGHFDGATDLFGRYVTVVGPSWQRCRQAMVNRYGGAWCDAYPPDSPTFRQMRHRLTEHERIVVDGESTVRLVLDDVHAEALAENAEVGF